MAKQTFTVTTGNEQEITLTPPIDPGNPSGVIAIQNNGTGTLTVKGKLLDQASYMALGTVAAETIGAITFLPGLTHLELSAVDSTGIVVW